MSRLSGASGLGSIPDAVSMYWRDADRSTDHGFRLNYRFTDRLSKTVLEQRLSDQVICDRSVLHWSHDQNSFGRSSDH